MYPSHLRFDATHHGQPLIIASHGSVSAFLSNPFHLSISFDRILARRYLYGASWASYTLDARPCSYRPFRLYSILLQRTASPLFRRIILERARAGVSFWEAGKSSLFITHAEIGKALYHVQTFGGSAYFFFGIERAEYWRLLLSL